MENRETWEQTRRKKLLRTSVLTAVVLIITVAAVITAATVVRGRKSENASGNRFASGNNAGMLSQEGGKQESAARQEVADENAAVSGEERQTGESTEAGGEAAGGAVLAGEDVQSGGAVSAGEAVPAGGAIPAGEAAGVSARGYEIRLIDGIAYVDGILIANKTYSLPSDYNPGKIDDTVMEAFYEMQSAAAAEGLNLYISSGFRSYSTQSWLYNSYVERDGQEEADTYSARAGYSEHQTGLCFDLNTIDETFAYTPESKWIEKHAWEYGFIIRYPKGKESITGYMYEPWHLRYLGGELAEKVYNSGLCLEEYLGITSVYSD